MSITESRVVNKAGRAGRKLLYWLGLRKHPRTHRYLLRNRLLQLMKTAPEPVVIETGCIRKLKDRTESTLTIAETLNGRGRFYTYELRPENIEVCRQVCADYNQTINYIEGDSVTNLTAMVKAGLLDRIDFAFLDSVNDGAHIFNEFKVVEPLFPVGAVLVVDDVLFADKGRIIRPYLEDSPDWTVRVHNVENGILVAKKIGMVTSWYRPKTRETRMISREIDQKIRDWIHSMPGHFDGADSAECLRKAWDHSGIQCSVDDFRRAIALYGHKPIALYGHKPIALYGYKPNEIRPGIYRLFTPAPPVATASVVEREHGTEPGLSDARGDGHGRP